MILPTAASTTASRNAGSRIHRVPWLASAYVRSVRQTRLGDPRRLQIPGEHVGRHVLEFRACRQFSPTGMKYRGASEAGVANAAARAALLLPEKGAVKRDRRWSSSASVSGACIFATLSPDVR
jgi:hypothetical protein